MRSADDTWDDVPPPPGSDAGAGKSGSVPLALEPGPLPPRYDRSTLEVLGQGGLGTVFSVLDAWTGRRVALKVLHRRPGSSRASRSSERRFVREARITAQLQHPGIVPVYEIGEFPEGGCYYTMKRVRGRTLEDALGGARTLADRLAFVPELVQVAHAVAYAHSRGVVHRDLKPANVMVGEFGETLVLDWGIAKLLGRSDVQDPGEGDDPIQDRVPQEQTAVGTILGTPAFMSPEQARGDLDVLDARSDVWSLGAMLYQVVTGRRPFDGPDVVEAVRHGVAPRPRDTTPEAPPELAAIVERAMSADPADRYATAAALAEELEAWLAGRAVKSYRYALTERVHRVYDRARTVIVTALAVSVPLVVAAAAGYVVLSREHADTREALRARWVAEADARADLEPGAAASSAARALAAREGPVERGLLLRTARRWAPRRVATADAGGCAAPAFSGDAAACGEGAAAWPTAVRVEGVAELSARDDGTLFVRSATGASETLSLGGGPGRIGLVEDPVAPLAVDVRADGRVWFVDPAGPAILGRLPALARSADAVALQDRRLLVVTAGGELQTWELPEGGLRGSGLVGGPIDVDALAFAGDTPLGLSLTSQSVRRFDPVTGRAEGRGVGVGAAERVLAATVTPEGTPELFVTTRVGLASASPPDRSGAWGTPSGSHGAVLLDRSRALLAGDDGVPVLWNLPEARELGRLDQRFARALPAPCGRLVVFEAADGGVSTLDLDRQRLQPLELPTLAGASASGDGSAIVGPVPGGLRVLDVATGARRLELATGSEVGVSALSTDAAWVAWTAAADPRTHLTRVADGSLVAVDARPRGTVRWLAFAPDGGTLWIGSAGGVTAWDTSLAAVPGATLAERFSP